MKLTVIIPAYREEATIGEVVRRALAADLSALALDLEVVLVDDGSDDRTHEMALAVAATDPRLRVVRQERNRGKGAAIRRALDIATGDFVLIQDADLEYDPSDWPHLLMPALRGAPVVYGSRFLERRWPTEMRPANWLINRLLAWLANFLYGLRITDEATCLKLFRADVLRSFRLECERFEFCPEVTAKSGLRRLPIVEVPVRYAARTAVAGKKIRWTDGVQAVWTLLRWRFGRRARAAREGGL